jgi:hypothetical protein
MVERQAQELLVLSVAAAVVAVATPQASGMLAATARSSSNTRLSRFSCCHRLNHITGRDE